MNYRIIRKKINRYRGFIWKLINILRFKLWAVEFGKSLCIHGYPYLKLAPEAKLTIGDNFYMSSGYGINPLSSNRRSVIHATDGASIKIGNNVGISSGVLRSALEIRIGDNVKLGGNCIVIDTDAHSMDYIVRRDRFIDKGNSSPIVIEDDVLVGANCIILKGVTIGARSIVGAGSVVTKSIPADSIAAGNPARVIKTITRK